MLATNSSKLFSIQNILHTIFGADLHKKRQLSLTPCTLYEYKGQGSVDRLLPSFRLKLVFSVATRFPICGATIS